MPKKHCCELFRYALSDKSLPVVATPNGAFVIMASDGGMAFLRFCPWCGHDLQLEETLKAVHGAHFHEIDRGEREEASALVEGLSSAAALIEILGHPDEIVDSGDSIVEARKLGTPAKRCLKYTNRWKSLVLQVIEMDDGSIMTGIDPKPK